MSIPFSRAPHIEGVGSPLHPSQAPNAALLIDFDNVTMGMRSDLSKELKTLLNSEVIRGKVTVQRAYADWRRYPQYIVPLSEASIDLIFAPAYGSSKKNATDIRMAIDGMELVFTRPEIGTYILLTGDSDFSSLVLKLKEYGKYVIGVGIQESSSDILVQNCDEYYSYTSLSGLRKTDELGSAPSDPWVLVEKAAEQMGKRGDVMRSDRLKQVMLELDPGFDEKSFGFNKFSRFLTEAVRKGLLQTQKMENGQYEIVPLRGARKGDEPKSPSGRREAVEAKRPDRSRPERPAGEAARARTSISPRRPAATPAPTPGASAVTQASDSRADRGGLAAAYVLLRRAINDLLEDQDSDVVRDSDVKRRMLALESGFDEDKLGFPKFSRFLRQAHDHEVVDLRKGEGGNYHVGLGSRVAPPGETVEDVGARAAPEPSKGGDRPATRPPASPAASPERTQVDGERPTRSLRPREAGLFKGRMDQGDPPLFEGQIIRPAGTRGKEAASQDAAEGDGGGASLDPAAMRLPTGRDSIVQYLSNSYSGVGQKTAETLVDAFGEELFVILHEDPARVRELLPASRAEKVLDGWRADHQRRVGKVDRGPDAGGPATESRRESREDASAAPSKPAPNDQDRPQVAGNRGPSNPGRRPRRTRGGAR